MTLKKEYMKVPSNTKTRILTPRQAEQFDTLCHGGYTDGDLILMSTTFNGIPTPCICHRNKQGDIYPLAIMIDNNHELLAHLRDADGVTVGGLGVGGQWSSNLKGDDLR